MAGEDEQAGVESSAWRDKTDFLVGVDLSQPPPEMRYQLLGGRVYTLQRLPSGAVIRGEIDVAELILLTGSDAALEGWYDGHGVFLGDDPGFTQD